MSIILLQTFQIDPETRYLELDDDFAGIMILNIVSLLIFAVYCVLYKKVVYFNRNPNSIIFLKISSSAMLTLHFLVLFSCLSYPNKLQEWIINFSAIVSVPILYSCYYFNCCIAHNIYETYFSYNKSFEKREKKYYIYGVSSIILMIYLSFHFHESSSLKEIERDEIHFTLKMFNQVFVCLFYLLTLVMMVYMCLKIILVLKGLKTYNFELYSTFISDSQESQENSRIVLVKQLVTSFVKRNLLFTLSFVFGNAPNNICAIYMILFNKSKIKIFHFRRWNTFFMSLNLLISLIVILMDPCIRIYLKYMIQHYLFGKDIKKMMKKINGVGKYSSIYGVTRRSASCKKFSDSIEMEEIKEEKEENESNTSEKGFNCSCSECREDSKDIIQREAYLGFNNSNLNDTLLSVNSNSNNKSFYRESKVTRAASNKLNFQTKFSLLEKDKEKSDNNEALGLMNFNGNNPNKKLYVIKFENSNEIEEKRQLCEVGVEKEEVIKKSKLELHELKVIKELKEKAENTSSNFSFDKSNIMEDTPSIKKLKLNKPDENILDKDYLIRISCNNLHLNEELADYKTVSFKSNPIEMENKRDWNRFKNNSTNCLSESSTTNEFHLVFPNKNNYKRPRYFSFKMEIEEDELEVIDIRQLRESLIHSISILPKYNSKSGTNSKEKQKINNLRNKVISILSSNIKRKESEKEELIKSQKLRNTVFKRENRFSKGKKVSKFTSLVEKSLNINKIKQEEINERTKENKNQLKEVNNTQIRNKTENDKENEKIPFNFNNYNSNKEMKYKSTSSQNRYSKHFMSFGKSSQEESNTEYSENKETTNTNHIQIKNSSNSKKNHKVKINKKNSNSNKIQKKKSGNSCNYNNFNAKFSLNKLGNEFTNTPHDYENSSCSSFKFNKTPKLKSKITRNLHYDSEIEEESKENGLITTRKHSSCASIDKEFYGRSSLSILDNNDFELMMSHKINSEKMEKIISIFCVLFNSKEEGKKHKKNNSSHLNTSLMHRSSLHHNHSIKAKNHKSKNRELSKEEIKYLEESTPETFIVTDSSLKHTIERFSSENGSVTNKIKHVCIEVISFLNVLFDLIRRIKSITKNEVLLSFHPERNLESLSNKRNFRGGGRSGIPISMTYDNKFLIKGISITEKNVLKKMIFDYYSRIKTNSLLCPILGMFKYRSKNNNPEYEIIMKNMAEITYHGETLSKLFTFDLKGSTVDRMTLSYDEVNLYKEFQENLNDYSFSMMNGFNLSNYSCNDSWGNNSKIINTLQSKKDMILKDEDFRLLALN